MKIVGECRYHVVDVYKHSLYSLKELEEDMRDVDFFRSHLKDEIKLYLEAKVDNKFNRYHILKLGLFLHDAESRVKLLIVQGEYILKAMK